GTHAVFAAAFDHIDIGETTLARRLLGRLRPGMLCLADRAFVGFELWAAAGATGADLLWRLRVNQVLPCDKVLPDRSELSRLYTSPQHRGRFFPPPRARPPGGMWGAGPHLQISPRRCAGPGAAISPGNHAARSGRG